MKTTNWQTTLVVAVLLMAVIGSQSAAFALAPASGVTPTGKVLGDTGFAYLSGVRVFAAAVLWNRLEPQGHDYYEGLMLRDQVYVLPTIQAVTMLDPQLEQPYAIGSYILATRGDMETALEVAREGVDSNPNSGYLRANLALILIMDDPKANLEEMLVQAEAGVSDDMQWFDEDALFEGIATFRTVYQIAGDDAQVERMQSALDKLRASGTLTQQDHDHDGDGAQDH